MPKRDDIRKIMIVGSGPILIGQACEFDYSGTQACKALREEGYQVVLVNSNPATIMTDPDFADSTYIEPLTAEFLTEVIVRERPDALLPTVGGQTGLNLSVELALAGVLEEHGVEMIGANLEAVRVAEDRRLFKKSMESAGLAMPRSGYAAGLEEARKALDWLGLPVVIRPSFTLGGSGGGIARNRDEFEEIISNGLVTSPVHEVLIEESVIGWKEFELELMRDLSDNVVVICSIENLDPMGVHTGDSMTVAPIQTLTDKEYQTLRDSAIQIIRRVGVETGGSNIQFAVNPRDGRLVVIEMNPRVSRSSALASKATGFPIAKIAAKLAVGYRLDEIPNDITRRTPASFEPTLDYVVIKIPKFAFEKFPSASPVLGTQMKSVGEVMAMGGTFKEALLKALRALETGTTVGSALPDPARLEENLSHSSPQRILNITQAFRLGWEIQRVHEMTGIDPWFLQQIFEIVQMAQAVAPYSLQTLPVELFREAKRTGFSDARLAHILSESPPDNPTGPRVAVDERDVRKRRLKLGLSPVFKRVDTCAAEFESFTPYFYSTYEEEDESDPTSRRKIMILGSGPNRIGQGIEFDYCCCHASFALRQQGFETIMVNCNPETVSTDYDTSDRLYFEPLTFEDVMNIVEREKPEGVIVQFGGQTPLNLSKQLQQAGVPIIGTQPEFIDLAEDRKLFGELLSRLSIRQPRSGTASDPGEALDIGRQIGFPLLLRPSYVLGGRAMVIVYDEAALTNFMRQAREVGQGKPILIDEFLEDAFEYDVDALADGAEVVIGGIMEHVEEAGIHSGDSTSVLPPIMIREEHMEAIRATTRRLGKALSVVGLMNVQYAIKGDLVYVLEVNPRASRTVPFVSKATGVPLAKIAASLMVGKKLRDFGLPPELMLHQHCVKVPVFPFSKFAREDPLLGPEMKSTGEVMGSAENYGYAMAKAQLAAGLALPTTGTILLTVNMNDKENIVPLARDLASLGFTLIATQGTSTYLRLSGLTVGTMYKVNEGRPHIVDYIRDGRIQLIINTPLGRKSYFDELAIRRAAIQYGVPCFTTLSGAAAAVAGIRALQDQTLSVCSLQELQRSAVRG